MWVLTSTQLTRMPQAFILPTLQKTRTQERGQINCLDVVHVAYQMAASIHYLHQRRSAKSWKLREDPRRIEFVSDGTIFVLLPHASDWRGGYFRYCTAWQHWNRYVEECRNLKQSSLQERGAPRCQGRQLSDGSKGHFDVWVVGEKSWTRL